MHRRGRVPRRGGSRMSSHKVAALVSSEMASVIPNLLAEICQTLSNRGSQNNREIGHNGETRHPCNFKHFNSCNPFKFPGSKGVTSLLQWFESIENTFTYSKYPEALKVRYGTSVFQDRALTWWNGIKRDKGEANILAMTWDEVKQHMIKKFCPQTELQKLEEEFWNLKQEGGDHLA
ncbi:hypothetical protein QVD17_24550 [Tagetes erecta]|uniref:Retrotransposon gag domain-containing protein n=1 Tax=Tagetes erecta TaxID=13708 RepID=A0AAD8NUU0_TARER|nr:hypothetical protein QVD17_24550 [Tagetes erecta]